jgi:hypothetical protein
MRFIYVIILSLFCLNTGATARKIFAVQPVRIKADTDTTTAPVRKQSVSVGVTAGSDVSFFGRTSPKRYRYYTADLIYNAKSGFFAYGNLWKVSGSYPTIDEVDVGGGYVYRLWRNLSGSASYTHFFFNRNSQIIKSLSTNDADLKTNYDWKFVKTSVAFDYLFGKAHDVFVTPSISKHIEPKWSVFDDKDYMTFTPGISMILGTQNFVEHYSNAERDDPNPDAGYGHETDNLEHRARQSPV